MSSLPKNTNGSLKPDDALKASQTRLILLNRLASRPEISPARKKVLDNLVRAQEAVVKLRKGYLGQDQLTPRRHFRQRELTAEETAELQQMSEDRAVLQDKLREALARGDTDRAGMLRAAIQSHAREMATLVSKTMEEAPSERVNLANGPADQLLIPGGERSALQAAAAREGALKAKRDQQPPGGLFAPPEPDQGEIKFARQERPAITSTPSFKAWFGDSQVVDGNGRPKIVFHGTNVHRRVLGENERPLGDIDQFDRLAAYKAFGRREGMDAVGSWFSEHSGTGREHEAAPAGAGMYSGLDDGGAIYPVYLRIESPWMPKDFNEFLDKMHAVAGRDPKTQRPRGLGSVGELREWLKAEGHDGILFAAGEIDHQRAGEVWVALEPTQVKSAMNGGAFDPNDPRISYAKAPIFYSALERHVDNSTLKAARPDNLRPAAPTPPERLSEIAKRYGEGQSYRTIMSEMGVSSSTINRAIDLHRVERRPQIGEDGYQHPASIDEALREEALRLYSDHQMSADGVARRLGISQPVVSRIVKEAGATRSPSERMAIRSEGQTRAERGVAAPWQSFKDGSWLYAHSTYELARMRQLDHDPDVVSYTKRVDRVPMSDGTTYVPDLEIHYRDGRTEVEEIKPEWQLNDPGVLAKARAAKEYFGQLGKEYRLVSEHEIGRQGFADLLDEPFSTLSPEQRQRIRKATQATMARLDKSQKLLRGQTPSDFRQPKGVVVGRAVPGDREAQTFADKVEAAVRKIAPFAEVVPARHITEVSTGDKAMGVSWRDGLRHIVGWSVEAKDAIGIARHEAVHALRGAGLIRPHEWETLEEAATNEGWGERYNIARRYGELTTTSRSRRPSPSASANGAGMASRACHGIVHTVFQRIAKAARPGARPRQADLRGQGRRPRHPEPHGVRRDGPAHGQGVSPADAPHDVVTEPAFARRPVNPRNAERAQREAEVSARSTRGRPRLVPPHRAGVDATWGPWSGGRKLQSAADRALPDPISEALEDTGHAVNMAVNPWRPARPAPRRRPRTSPTPCGPRTSSTSGWTSGWTAASPTSRSAACGRPPTRRA
jgi:transposase